jgi:hypothetical protein
MSLFTLKNVMSHLSASSSSRSFPAQQIARCDEHCCHGVPRDGGQLAVWSVFSQILLRDSAKNVRISRYHKLDMEN